MEKGQTVIVIGASGGIGRVLSREFLKAGVNATLSARTKEKLDTLQVSLGSENTLVVPADATNPDDVLRVFTETKKKFGTVDGIVISAGTWKQLDITASTQEALDLAENHFRSIFLPSFVTGFVAQRFFREQGRGIIFNISSHAGLRPELEGNLTYGPMKAASHQFTLALKNELKGTGIQVVDIAPAIVNTDEAVGILDTEDKRTRAVQPEAIARWIIDEFNNPNIVPTKLFKSDITL